MFVLFQVCATFFHNTLNISWNMVAAAKQFFKDGGFRREPRPETRGDWNKVAEKVIDSTHINSFTPVPSHWCKKRSQKLYLPSELSVNRMYKQYVDNCMSQGLSGDDMASKDMYRKVSILQCWFFLLITVLAFRTYSSLIVSLLQHSYSVD